MDFIKRLRPLPCAEDNILRRDDCYVWGASMTRDPDGKYYLLYAYWEKKYGFQAWVTHSKVGIAVGESPMGRFTPIGDALTGSGVPDGWDRDCIHNPTVLQYEGKYYLYYMGTRGDGSFWDDRNHQRIGVAVADHPAGPWTRFDRPVLDVCGEPDAHDALMVSNPTLCTAHGEVFLIYKGCAMRDPLPRGGPVVCGSARAASPLGPFTRSRVPLFQNPEHSWSVEDPCLWYEDGRFYCLAKDFHGTFTGGEGGQSTLFVSDDFKRWEHEPASALAISKTLQYANGGKRKVAYLERPQLYRENGRPKILLCACSPDEAFSDTFNIRFELEEAIK